jgi:hypothetical protein
MQSVFRFPVETPMLSISQHLVVTLYFHVRESIRCKDYMFLRSLKPNAADWPARRHRACHAVDSFEAPEDFYLQAPHECLIAE